MYSPRKSLCSSPPPNNGDMSVSCVNVHDFNLGIYMQRGDAYSEWREFVAKQDGEEKLN